MSQTPEDALLEKIKSDTIKNFKEIVNNDPEIKELKSLSEKIKSATTDQDIADCKKSIEEVGLMIKSLKENQSAKTKSTGFADNLWNSYKAMFDAGKIGTKNADGEFTIKIGKGSFESMEFKSAGTITESNVTPVGTNAIPFTLADYMPNYIGISRRNPFIVQLCNLGRTAKRYIQWVEVANPDGGASTTSEGSAKTQQDFDLVEKSATVQKMTSYVKASKESLDDIPYMESLIRSQLMELVILKLDAQVLGGDGSAPNLNGILTQATTFSAGTFANAVDYANRFDVLRVAVNQIEIASGGDTNFSANFVPNYIVLHPTDVTAMELTKSTQGVYLLPPFMSVDGNVISGCRVIANTGITAGTFLVGDFSKAFVKMREDAMISVGYENDDFTKNLVTILCETRAVIYIPSNYLKAFVTGSFSTALASLKNTLS